jgi:hypothetical protein
VISVFLRPNNVLKCLSAIVEFFENKYRNIMKDNTEHAGLDRATMQGQSRRIKMRVGSKRLWTESCR